VIRILFGIIATLGLLTALGTVLARNLVHAALFLVAFFFLVACQFVLLEAEFLAAMQVLVYIGAVAILIMFGIMLTRNIQGDETTAGHWVRKVPAAAVGLGLLAILALGIGSERGGPGVPAWTETTSRRAIPDLAAPPPPTGRPRPRPRRSTTWARPSATS
jgi:NADH-quinone oxidoreductase subunit J